MTKIFKTRKTYCQPILNERTKKWKNRGMEERAYVHTWNIFIGYANPTIFIGYRWRQLQRDWLVSSNKPRLDNNDYSYKIFIIIFNHSICEKKIDCLSENDKVSKFGQDLGMPRRRNLPKMSKCYIIHLVIIKLTFRESFSQVWTFLSLCQKTSFWSVFSLFSWIFAKMGFF